MTTWLDFFLEIKSPHIQNLEGGRGTESWNKKKMCSTLRLWEVETRRGKRTIKYHHLATGEWLPVAVYNTKRHSLAWAISWEVWGLCVFKWHEPRQYSTRLYFCHPFGKLLIEWNQDSGELLGSWYSCFHGLLAFAFYRLILTSLPVSNGLFPLCTEAWNEQSRQYVSCRALGLQAFGGRMVPVLQPPLEETPLSLSGWTTWASAVTQCDKISPSGRREWSHVADISF